MTNAIKEDTSFLFGNNQHSPFGWSIFWFYFFFPPITAVFKSSLGDVFLCVCWPRCRIRSVCLLCRPSSGRSPWRRKSVNKSTTFYCALQIQGILRLCPGPWIQFPPLFSFCGRKLVTLTTRRPRSIFVLRRNSIRGRSFDGYKDARLRTLSPGLTGYLS